MRRLFASLCLVASLTFVVAGCGGEDPEIAKNEPLLVEIVKSANDLQTASEAIKKEPARSEQTKVLESKLLDSAAKYLELKAKFETLPKSVQEKLIAKQKVDWEKLERIVKK